jgi:hypothetical protein
MAQCQPVEKGNSDDLSGGRVGRFAELLDTPAFGTENGMTLILPLPKRSAVSIASTNRVRFSS